MCHRYITCARRSKDRPSRPKHILREINLAISDKAGCLSDLLTEWEII